MTFIIRAACQIIHSSFQMTIRSKELVIIIIIIIITILTIVIAIIIITKVKGREGAAPRPWLNKSLVAVKEQGMLFHYR